MLSWWEEHEMAKEVKLKYIFHDYAKMKMHGLIKKAFTEGSAYGTRLYYRVEGNLSTLQKSGKQELKSNRGT